MDKLKKLKNLEQKLKRDETSEPKAEGTTPAIPTLPILTRLDAFEKSVSFVQDTNRYILIVLFVGFFALAVSAIGATIQAINSNTKTEIEFIKSVQDLKNEIDNLKNNLPQPAQKPLSGNALPIKPNNP